MAMLCSALQAVIMVTLTKASHIDDAVSPSQDPQHLVDDSGNNLEFSWSPAKLEQLENLFTPMKNDIGELYESFNKKENDRCHRNPEQLQRFLIKVNNPAFTLEFLLYDSEIARPNPGLMFKKLIKMEERIEQLIETGMEKCEVFYTSMKGFLATTKELKKILKD